MASFTKNKPTTAAVVVPLNPKSWTNISTTIQNQTGAALTVTVTNQQIQSFADEAAAVAGALWSPVPAAALSIAANAVGVLNSPHEAIQLAGTGTGNIYIVMSY